MSALASFLKGIAWSDIMKFTLSKPRKGIKESNWYGQLIETNSGLQFKITKRYKTQDITQTTSISDLEHIIEEALTHHFQNADFWTKGDHTSLMQSKKGKLTTKTKKHQLTLEIESHDRKKHRLIPEDEPFLRGLGLSSAKGLIYQNAQDKYKQINRYIELLDVLIKDDEVHRIYDMGSGKGYLTFALHHYFLNKGKKLSTTGIEIRPDLVEKCNKVAQSCMLTGLQFQVGSIDDFNIPKSDVVIALHACDVATDMAISQGLRAEAKYIVVAPCCHKQIRKELSSHHLLDTITNHGIYEERLAEMITDTIRALILKSRGYETKIFEFISSEHTGKNTMITAKYIGKKDPTANKKIEELKNQFGIKTHFLETIVPI